MSAAEISAGGSSELMTDGQETEASMRAAEIIRPGVLLILGILTGFLLK